MINDNKTVEVEIDTVNDEEETVTANANANLGVLDISPFLRLYHERSRLESILKDKLPPEGNGNDDREGKRGYIFQENPAKVNSKREESKIGSSLPIELNVVKEATTKDIGEITARINENEKEMTIIGEELGHELVETLEENGFLYVVGHLICPFLLHQAIRYGKGFFRDSNLEEKRKAYSKDRARRGYSDLNSENFASLLGMKGPNDYVEKFRFGPTITASSKRALEMKESNDHQNQSQNKVQQVTKEEDNTTKSSANSLLSTKVKSDPLLMENIFPDFTLNSHLINSKKDNSFRCPSCRCSTPCPSSSFETVMLKYYEEVHKVSVALLELLERGIKICLQRYKDYLDHVIDEKTILNFNLTSLLTSVENQHTGIVSVNYYPEVDVDSGKRDDKKKQLQQQQSKEQGESQEEEIVSTDVDQSKGKSKTSENDKRKLTSKLRYRVAPHTDVSLFTLLYQEPIIPGPENDDSSSYRTENQLTRKDYGGLHIQSPNTKEWLAIPPPHLVDTSQEEGKQKQKLGQSEGCGGFIFNIGDCLNYITCGGIPSTIHSVLLPSFSNDETGISSPSTTTSSTINDFEKTSSSSESVSSVKLNKMTISDSPDVVSHEDNMNIHIARTIPDRLTLVYFVGPGSNSVLPSIPLDEYFRVNSFLRNSNDTEIRVSNEKLESDHEGRNVDKPLRNKENKRKDFGEARLAFEGKDWHLTSFPKKPLMTYGKWRKERVKIAMKKLRENNHF